MIWYIGAPKGGVKGAIAPLKSEKIENFIAFTRNLIPKSLKTEHFLTETSKIDFSGSKYIIFQNFALYALGISRLPLKI